MKQSKQGSGGVNVSGSRGKELQIAEQVLVEHLSTERLQEIAMRELAGSIAQNEFGLPVGYYRVDLLPVEKYIGNNIGGGSSDVTPTEVETAAATEFFVNLAEGTNSIDGTLSKQDLDYIGHRKQQLQGLQGLQSRGKELQPEQIIATEAPSFRFTRADLNNAFVQLSYLEGFPTLPNGQPFWTQLDHEPPIANLAFSAYCQLHTLEHQGTRQLAQLPEFLANMAKQAGYQQIVGMAELQTYYHLYCWQYRVRAYDLYRVAAWRKKQEERAIALLDDQFFKMQKISNRLMDYMGDEENFWELMTPAAAVNLLKVVASIQRLAVGLPAGAPIAETKGELGRGSAQSLELVLRQLSQGDAGIRKLVTDEAQAALITKTLADPDALRLAQELIVRFHTTN